jgi:NAD(P)-dependent dehydrogenase (short-subunit alcohol dehydrogenase family)
MPMLAAEAAFEGAAVVTGGSQGIGAAVARRLTTLGLHTTIFDLQEKREQGLAYSEEIGATFASIDVCDENSVRQAFAVAGPPDVLVNCAGLSIAGQPVDEVSLTDWNSQLAVNLTGTFLCIRAAAAPMREKRYGRIINIASAIANRGLPGSNAGYAAAKAGVVGLTLSVAAELAPFGVTVNAIAPGYVDTPMTRNMSLELRERRAAEIGMGRFARADEIASVVAFLASPAASYITGALIQATGGFRI